MGRKKILTAGGGQGASNESSLELKPFCYYCDREFDDGKTLITHQRAKHFNCAECGLKFDTVTGLRVHMLNAYKKTMKEVPNSIPGRENPDIVVHGMEGLPKGILEEKTRKAQLERAEQNKQREEENKDRLKAISASKSGAAGEGGKAAATEAPAAAAQEEEGPPAKASKASGRPVMEASAPSEGRKEKARQREKRQVLEYLEPPPQPPEEAVMPPMPGLSPAVAQLLSGGTGPAPGTSNAAAAGLPDHMVPPALAGLHPAALQALAAAGVLAPAKGGGAGEATGHQGGGGVPRAFELTRLAAPGGLAPPLPPMVAGAGSLGQMGAMAGAMGGGFPVSGMSEPVEKRLRIA